MKKLHPERDRGQNWGKKSALLPNKTSLNSLNRTQRTIVDYAKRVPTNPAVPDSPLLVNLMRKGAF